MPNTKGFPAISFTNKNGYIYRTVVDKNGNIDLKRRAVYKLYKTGNKVKDDKGKEIDEIKLCKLVYNDKFKNYIPKYLAKNATILKEKDVEEFNTYVSGEASAMPLAWKNDFNNIRAHDEICTIDNLPPKLQSEVRQHPQYLQYGIRNFIKVDSGGEVEDETYIAYGYKNTIVPLCYKKNGDDWQNIAQNTYDNIIVYEDGFTYASPQLSNKEAINAQIYVPETEFYSPYAEQFSQNMLGRNGHKDRKGCNFQIETHTAGKRNAAISRDIVRQNQQIMQNTFDGKDTDNGFIRESPLRIISGDGKNLQCVITDKMDTNQVQDIVKRHNVGRVLIAAHQNSQQELSESFTKQTQEYQQHGQELLRQVQQERAQNTNGKIQNYEQELLYQCYLDPKLFQTLWHVSISLAEDLLTGLFNLPDIDDPNEEKQIKNDMLKYLNNLNQNQKRDLLKKAKKIVDRDKEYHEQELKLLPNNCLNLQNYANRGTCTLYDNIPTAPIADSENNYFYSFNENNKGANELFVNNPKDYDEDVSDLMATMYFINPAPDVDTLDAINSMTINCCVPDLPQMFSNRQKEYTVSSLEVGKRDVCITPINTNSKLVFSHAIDKFSTKGKCGIIKKDKSVQKDLPFPATGAVIHFSDDTIVVINNVEDESTIHIKIFPNDKLKQTLTTGNNKLDTHWKEGDYVDIVLEDDKAELAIRNANYAGFSDDKKEYPRQIDLSDKAAEIMPALKAYRLNSLLRSVPQYISPVAPLKLYKTDNSLISGKENIFSGNFKFTEVKNRKGQELKPKQLSLSPLSSDSPTINTNILNERYILMPELNHDFEKRIAQLNSFQNAALIPILYEDSTNGKISDDNFIKNRKNYIKFHDDIRQNFLQKFKEIRNEVERLRNGVQREIEGSKNEDALKNIAKNSLKEIFLSSLKGAKFSPESSLDKKLQQDLSEELKTLYSDLKIDEENGMTNVARVADYARQVSEELMRSADEQITKQQKCIKNLHPLALESYNSKQSPRIIGQQYLRLLAYENALQHTKQRQTSGIDTEPDLNFKSFSHKGEEKNTIITDHKQKVAELDKKYQKSNEILDKYSELLEKVIWQVETQPKSTLEEKQGTIYEYGALVQAMMLVETLMDRDPNDKDRSLVDLQEEIAKSFLLNGSILAKNELMLNNSNEPVLDIEKFKQLGIITLEQLFQHLNGKKTEYEQEIANDKNIPHIPLPSKPRTAAKKQPKNVVTFSNKTLSKEHKLKMALHVKEAPRVIVKLLPDTEGKMVPTYFKQIKLQDNNGRIQIALVQVNFVKDKNGNSSYMLYTGSAYFDFSEDTITNYQWYEDLKKQGIIQDLAITPKDLPEDLKSYNTDNAAWIKMDDDTYVRWDNSKNPYFHCYKNQGNFWQDLCDGSSTIDDIMAFDDGAVMATSCMRANLNNALCNFYMPNFKLVDPRAQEYMKRCLVESKYSQPKGYCITSTNQVPSKKYEETIWQQQNALLDNNRKSKEAILPTTILHTDNNISKPAICLRHPLKNQTKDGWDQNIHGFFPNMLQNIYYKKRVDEYQLSDIYREIQNIDAPELKEYDEAIKVISSMKPSEKADFRKWQTDEISLPQLLESNSVQYNQIKLEVENKRPQYAKYARYAKIIDDHDNLIKAYACSPNHPLGNNILTLDTGDEREIQVPTNKSSSGKINPNYAEPANYEEEPNQQASGTMYYIDPISLQKGPGFLIAHRNINGTSTLLADLYNAPVDDVMLDVESNTCASLVPEQKIYVISQDKQSLLRNAPSFQAQLKKSDGSLTPSLNVRQNDALIKFDDDTIAHFMTGNKGESAIRIFPNQKLFNELNTLLQSKPICKSMEDGDFLEISINNPPHLLLKNHKDTQTRTSEQIGCLVENKRGIDLATIAVPVIKTLKGYRLNSLARSCGTYTARTNEQAAVYTMDEHGNSIVGYPNEINIFNPKKDDFKQAEILEDGSSKNKKPGKNKNKPDEISLKQNFLNTNFDIRNFLPNSYVRVDMNLCDQNVPNQPDIHSVFEQLYLKDATEYIRSFVSCLNNITTQIAIQLDQNPSELDEETIKFYGEYTKLQTILKNKLDIISKTISEINANIDGGLLCKQNPREADDAYEQRWKEAHKQCLKDNSEIIYNATKEIDELIKGFSSPKTKIHDINPLNMKRDVQQFDPFIFTNRYANFLNMLKFQRIMDIKLHEHLDFDSLINVVKTKDDIAKHTYDDIDNLSEIQSGVKKMEIIFASQQNWLMQNTLRASCIKDNANLNKDYFERCCLNAHASIALQSLLIQDPNNNFYTMDTIISTQTRLNSQLFIGCSYFFEPDGVTIKSSLKDLRANEVLEILQNEQKRLTKLTIPLENHAVQMDKKQENEYKDELSSQLTSKDQFKQLVKKKIQNQMTSATRGISMDSTIFDNQEKEIEQKLSETLLKNNKQTSNEDISKIKQELKKVLQAKLHLNCANRLLIENRVELDTTLEQKNPELQDEKLIVSLEDVKTTFAKEPEDSQPHTKMYIKPDYEIIDEKSLRIRATIVDILDDSDPELEQNINQQLKPSSETKKWYAKKPKYELYVDLSDKSQVEDFFINFRTHGLLAAVETCKIDRNKVGIIYHDDHNQSNDNTLTLDQYIKNKDFKKNDIMSSRQKKIAADMMPYYLMANLQKQTIKEFAKNQAKSMTK